MKIFVIGAGQVGATVVDALHDEHELTVIDLDEERLAAISQRYDVATLEGNGASRRALTEAGIATCDLLIACTSRDETNIVAAMISKACSARTTTVVRTTNPEYLEVWREGQLDVDFIVSSEVETALAISKTIGLRVSAEAESAGLDISEHGMYGYPEQFIPAPELVGYAPPATPLTPPAPQTRQPQTAQVTAS